MNDSENSPLRIGYIARISDCIMSLTMCALLIEASTPNAGLAFCAVG